jgi:hypothetical protein
LLETAVRLLEVSGGVHAAEVYGCVLPMYFS